MAKRKNSDAGSLDLLLDTICNAFGGIILIALLVIVLLSTRSKTKAMTAPTGESQSEMIEKDNERGKLTRELVELKQAVDNQLSNQSELLSEEAIELAIVLARLKKERTEKVIEKSEIFGTLSGTQEKINIIAEQSKVSKEKITAAENRLRRLKIELEKNFEKKAMPVSVSRETRSTLPPKCYFLKDGKFYGPVDLLSGIANNSDFRFITIDNVVHIRARQDAGTVVPDELSDLGSIAKKFAGITPYRYKIRLFVWPDSFARYDSILKVVKDKKFKLQLFFMQEGEPVTRGPDDGSQFVLEN